MASLMNTYSRFPIAFEKGEGTYLYDENGKKYIDFGSGISVTNLGHCNKAVTEAICSQASTLVHTSNLFIIRKQEELSDLLSELSFQGKVFFCNSGAEANEGAIKLARLYGNKKYKGARYKIISMYNSFHGRTYATLSATGQAKVQAGFTPTAGYNVYVPFNDIDAVKQAASFGDVAAVIIEFFQGEGGVIAADKEYIKQLRDFCTEKDIIFIADEVQTGYGRTGEMFAHKLYGVVPDVMTVAKSMANGLPMGAFIAKDYLADYMTAGTHGSTFGGTPLACAAGIAVINEMTKPGFLEEVKRKGKLMETLLVEGLDAVSMKFNEGKLISDAIGAVTGKEVGNAVSGLFTGLASAINNIVVEKKCKIRGEGMLIGVQTEFSPKDVAEECLKNGLVVITAGNNSVRLYPPLTASDEEIKEGVKIFIQSIKNLQEKAK